MFVFDIEGDGLLDTISKIHCIVIYDLESDNLLKFTPLNIEEGVDFLYSCDTLIGHNIIGYDIPATVCTYGGNRQLPKILDTLIMSRLSYPERPGGHSLEAWGERLGYSKIEFNDYSKYSEEMLEYCVRDVELNVKVFKELEKEYEYEFREGFAIYT